MGNVQSEATQESESTKDGEEKSNPDTNKPQRESGGTKHDSGSQFPGPQAPERETVGQTLSGEPGGGDRQTGTAEMGKNHSKKSKLKLSSMWAQNSASGGMKEASFCDKDLGAEKWGLACLSRADLQSGQGLPEEPKGLKMALRSSPAVATHPDPRDLSTKKAPSKGKGKPESVHLAKSPGGMLQPGKMAETSQGGDTPKVVVETQVCWPQHVKSSSKEGLENEDWQPEPLPSAKKQAGAPTHGAEALKAGEDVLGGPASRSLNEKKICICQPAPSGCLAPPGVKKVPLVWAAGQREKELTGQPGSAPGSDRDFRGPAGAAQLSVDWAKICNCPTEKLQAAGSLAKAGAKSEAPGPEAVNSETMQELLEKGLNFLYKVTIQPGQWPPSIKAVKQKSSVISSGISYADVLKQCPQKKSPASTPAQPKALQQLGPGGKKLPSFKGLDRGNPEEFSSLSQLFLEHLRKVAPKEPAPSAPTQQVVTFEELSAGNPKRAEWQRPRPPTPYPQRRKGQGRKLPKFGTAVSQVVTFLGSDPKCDWFVQDESEMLLDEAPGAGEEGAADCADPPSVGGQGADAGGASQTAATLLLEQGMVAEIEGSPPRSCRKPQGLEEGAKERSPGKGPPPSAAQRVISPLVEDQSPVQFLGPGQPPALETPEVPPSPSLSTPACASVGPGADPKGPAPTQTRPKIRKQSLAAPKSKEKFKSPGQPKAKASKGKGAKPWPRAYGMNSQLRLDGVPLFPPFEKVARPFYFGEPLELSLPLDKPASLDQDASCTQPSAERDPEADRSHAHHWPAFQVADSCSRRCYCKHQDQRKLPKNVVAWLNPSSNHLAEPPWVATAMLAVSLVAGTKSCLESYEQQHLANED